MLLAHDLDGSGPAVLLLHSGIADRRMWDPLVPALSHHFTVVRPDLRGFGESPLPGGAYADVDDVEETLDALGLTRVDVVGSSLGGRVALELATTRPGRVSALVLLCPAHRGMPATDSVRTFSEEEERLLGAGDLEGAVALNVGTWLGPEATRETRDRLAAMQRHAFEVQLAAERAAAAAGEPAPAPRRVDVDPAAVGVPTLVVSGAHDLDHFRAVADHLATAIPEAESLRLPWAGHLPSLERPDAVLALLLDVLRHDTAVHEP